MERVAPGGLVSVQLVGDHLPSQRSSTTRSAAAPEVCCEAVINIIVAPLSSSLGSGVRPLRSPQGRGQVYPLAPRLCGGAART